MTIAAPIAIAWWAGEWWLLAAVPVLLALTLWAPVRRYVPLWFERHPWATSVVWAAVSGAVAGVFFGALEHSARAGVVFGRGLGGFWALTFRYSQGPKLVERARRNGTG
jgi:hypothetical protein